MTVKNGSISKIFLLVIVIVVPGYAALRIADYFMDVRILFNDPAETTGFGNLSKNGVEPYPLLPDAQVKNIILFIADGMGINHLTIARIHYYGPNGRMNISLMPVTGLLTTHSVDDLVTDSAAAATALASGFKTKNGMVGVDSAGVPLKSLLEAARDAGLATGLVTSSEITDATPAAFATHVANRDQQQQIARQLIAAKVNVLFGEGTFFYQAPDAPMGMNSQKNALAFAKDSGYEFVDSKAELTQATYDHVLGLFENITVDEKSSEVRIYPGTPTLAQLTSKAIALLKRNDKGFFLMVEEEGVDKGSHENREDYVLHYIKQFDDAVKEGLDYALADRTTLVIVTSDHETGGLNIEGGSALEKELVFDWETDNHTGQPVALFAFGPHAARFTGLKDNTELPKIMADLLDFQGFTF